MISCFILSDDNNAWDLPFFFIPVGLALLLGCMCFFLSLGKLVVLAIKLRKVKDVIVPYIRILFFVFIFFMVFGFFTAYVINDAANHASIASGYEQYYDCLSGDTYTPVQDCQLSDSVSNIDLVMLKGFAVSCLGLLLFFNFLSWELLVHWYRIGKACYLFMRSRDKDRALAIFRLVEGQSKTTTSFSKTSSLALSTVTPDTQIEQEEDYEDTSKSEEATSEE